MAARAATIPRWSWSTPLLAEVAEAAEVAGTSRVLLVAATVTGKELEVREEELLLHLAIGRIPPHTASTLHSQVQ